MVPSHVLRDLVGYIERGEVRPVLAATWPLAELREAQRAFIGQAPCGQHRGRALTIARSRGCGRSAGPRPDAFGPLAPAESHPIHDECEEP